MGEDALNISLCWSWLIDIMLDNVSLTCLIGTLQQDLVTRDDAMDRRFASDFARDISEIQDANHKAAVELAIYGPDKDRNRTLYYDGNKVLELCKNLMDWFMDKVLKDDRTQGFFGDTTAKH